MGRDLASAHHPISERFMADALPPIELSQEQLDFYSENGFLAGIRLLSDSQIEVLRGELAEFLQPDQPTRELWYEFHSNESADPETVLFHALGAWRIGQAFHDILWLPSFISVAEQLTGGPVRFWHDQLFCKPAKHGGVVAWHQDYSYWTRTKPMAHLTCWIGLDDSDSENGCVQYIPGSHQWELLPITGLAGDMEAIREVLTEEQQQRFESPVCAEMPAGHATFHHPLTIHGSNANFTDRPRRATVINTILDGVTSDSNDELLAGVPVVPAGEKLEGPFFPRLSQ